MSNIVTKPSSDLFRDHHTPGNAGSGEYWPPNSDIRTWGTELENAALDRVRFRDMGVLSYGAEASKILDFTCDALPRDMVFTRVGEAGYFNARGEYIRAPTNMPRFDYDLGVPTGITLEANVINHVRQSLNLLTSPWNSVGTVTAADGDVSPLGGRFTTVSTGANVGGDHRITAAIAANNRAIASAYVKQGTDTHAGFQVHWTGGSGTIAAGVLLNWATKEITHQQTSTLAVGGYPVGGGVWRIWCEALPTNQTNANVLLHSNRPANTNTQFHGVQYEYATVAGQRPSSLVPTTTVAGSRSVENLTLPLGQWFNPLEGTVFLDLAERPVNGSHLLYFSRATGGQRIQLFANAVGAMEMAIVGDDGNSAALTSRPLANGRNLIAVSYRAGAQTVAVNGSAITTVNAGIVLPTALTVLRLAHRSDGLTSPVLRPTAVAYLPRALSEAELARRTLI